MYIYRLSIYLFVFILIVFYERRHIAPSPALASKFKF